MNSTPPFPTTLQWSPREFLTKNLTFTHNSKDFLWFPSIVYSSMILSKLNSFISSKVLETSLSFLSVASLGISLSNQAHSLQNHAHLIPSPPHASQCTLIAQILIEYFIPSLILETSINNIFVSHQNHAPSTSC